MALKYTIKKLFRNGGRVAPKLLGATLEDLDKRIEGVDGSGGHVETVRIPADAAAADVWDRSLFRAKGETKITKISVIPDADIGQATNYMAFYVGLKGVDGLGTQTAANINVNSTNPAAKYKGINLPVAGGITLADTAVISLEKKKIGDGEAWPGGLVIVEYGPATE